jgi:hypothetical protein
MSSINNEEFIEQVCRQTDYSRDLAISKLAEYEQDVVKVVREYLTGSSIKKEVVKKMTSVNQQIYKEIRTMMDDASLAYEKSKRNAP